MSDLGLVFDYSFCDWSLTGLFVATVWVTGVACVIGDDSVNVWVTGVAWVIGGDSINVWVTSVACVKGVAWVTGEW